MKALKSLFPKNSNFKLFLIKINSLFDQLKKTYLILKARLKIQLVNTKNFKREL